ncbi:MAG: hypothetical protein IPM71_00285 [Bacteroidota bacterium]|nr:MAG: hypothetical protein IPM71_00285 [Bacteroidota bacterium]
MNKVLFTMAACLLLALTMVPDVQAQSNKEEIEYYQSIFGMEKKAVIADFLQLDPSNPFWLIYDEYETQRKELGKQRIDMMNNYVENYDKLDDAAYDELIKGMIGLRKSSDKLVDTYYKKIHKASGPKVAAQFFQLEAFFLSAIRIEVMSQIPYIGEFDM